MKKYRDLSKRTKFIIKLVISCVVIIGIILGLYFLFKHFGILDITQEQLQEYIEGFGVWAPLIFILISFLQVTFVPIPSSISIIVGSFLFGFWPSFFYSFIGIFLGSILAFLLGKFIGRPFVNWVAGGKETVDKYLLKMKGKEKIVVFFMFLFPFFPDDLICAICGILPISWLFFIATQIITRTTSILGNLLFLSGEFIPYNEPWGIATIVILCVLGVAAFLICLKFSDQINALFDKFTSWLSSKFQKNKSINKTEISNNLTENHANPDENSKKENQEK